jgi:ATP-binding cassette subfamily B protein
VANFRARERAGLGQVDLLGSEGRLEHWRYTAAQARSVSRFTQRFEALRTNEEDTGNGTTVCPSCGHVYPAEHLECPECAARNEPQDSTGALRRLVFFAMGQGKLIGLGFGLTVAATAIGLIPPYLTEPLVNNVLIPKQVGDPVQITAVFPYLGLMLLAAVVAWVLDWYKTYVMARVSERVAADLRDRTFRQLIGLSLEFFGGKRTGDLMARISTDTDRINYFLSVHLLDFATDVLLIAGTACILMARSPLLAAATLIPLPLALWWTVRVRDSLRHGFDAANRAWSAMMSVLTDTIPGIRVVKAFAQENREVQRFDRANTHIVRTNDRVNRVWSFFDPMLGLIFQGGLLVIWVVGAWLVFSHGLLVGTLTLFLTYLARLYGRLESMSRMVQATQRAGASAHRIFEILDRVPSVAEPARPIAPGRLKGQIELRDVNFRYGSRQVLFDINLKIAPGEMIGLVGPTGAGKSTLVNLICRFYDVQSGLILADGIDIRSFPIPPYRGNIGIVLQEPFLFFGSIAENIAYGRPDASRGDIIAAAKAARAHEFVLRLPDAYDTPVGERGQNLSGGERQRISIARALLIDPAILILDEATSAVDTETEREIQEALENLIRGRTTIAIAHRLSTLRKADRLVVLERGRIVEVGGHADLIGKPEGTFARLHRAQLELSGLNEALEESGNGAPLDPAVRDTIEHTP